jgi:hypothetical protein
MSSLPFTPPAQLRPGQTLVLIRRVGSGVHAHALCVPPHRRGDPGHPYSHITSALGRRGVHAVVAWGLDDYVIEAALPDGSTLILSPPQDPALPHPPGVPVAWHACRVSGSVYEEIYNSFDGGRQAQVGPSPGRLLTAVDGVLDRLGLPPDPLASEQGNGSRACEPLSRQHEPVLLRNGFVPGTYHGARFHRVPDHLASRDAQRAVVSRTVDALRAAGISVCCDPALIGPNRRPRTTPPQPPRPTSARAHARAPGRRAPGL